MPARFDAAMWPRLDAGGIPDGATVRLDDYTLRCAADGRGDWCVRCFAAPQRVLFVGVIVYHRTRADGAWRSACTLSVLAMHTRI